MFCKPLKIILSNLPTLDSHNPNRPNQRVVDASKHGIQTSIPKHASAYEKQRHATIACLVTKFRGYRHVKSLTPPTK